ncbi:flagellar protein FlbB [Bacillus sp. JCM 19045]|nr:flagellar protein FlbB [Bacillus sp. JCM 19045]
MAAKTKKSKWPIVLSVLIPLLAVLTVVIIFIGPLFGLHVGDQVREVFQTERTEDGSSYQQQFTEMEQEVVELQALLQEATNELVVREAEMNELQAQLDDATNSETNEEVLTQGTVQEMATGLEAVLKTYEEMSPKRAAALIDEMNEEEAYIHISSMKEQLRGSVIARLPAEKGATFLERLAQEGR